MPPSVYKGIESILDTVQRRPSAHESCEQKMKEIIQDVGLDFVWNGKPEERVRGLVHTVNYLMNVRDIRDDSVSRLTAFFAALAHMEDLVEGEKQPIFSCLFNKLMPFCEDKDPVRRVRAASIIVQLIRKLQHEEWLTDEQFDALERTAPLLAIDKVSAVRCEGIRLLAKLQNPRDPACPYMNKIMFHMAKDPKAEVRRTCVEVLALCTRSLVKIQLRSMDVETSVRKQVYQVYAKRIKLRVLQLMDRTHILNRGFSDRSPAVVQVVTHELLPAWLSQCKDSLLSLLDNIDPYHKPDTTMRIIDVLLERALQQEKLEEVVNEFVASHILTTINGTTTSDACATPQSPAVGDGTDSDPKKSSTDQLGILSASALMLWRGMCIFLKKHSDDALCHALLFKVLPETGRLADLMVRTVGRKETGSDLDALEVITHRLVCTQLILLLEYSDFSDFAGKSRLNEAIKTFLAQPEMEHYFEPLVSLLCTLHDNAADEVIPEVVDVISEIESPLMNPEDRQELLSRSICGDSATTKSLDENAEQMELDEGDAGTGTDKAPTKVRHAEEPLAVVQARVQATILREKIDMLATQQKFLEAQTAKEELAQVQAVITSYEEKQKRAEAQFLSKDDENNDDLMEHGDAFELTGANARCDEDQFKEMELDPTSARRCLAIMVLALQKATPKKLDIILENFIEQRALKAICMPACHTRSEAVRCLVYGCILSREFARSKMFILTHIAKSDTEEIRVLALRGIFDLLLRYGIKTFSSLDEDPSMLSVSRLDLSLHDSRPGRRGEDSDGDDPNNDQQEMQKIVLFLADFLKSREEKLLEVAVEGLCKLMFVGHLVSPRILAHLLSFWFNTKYTSNANIIHSLSLFFEAYCRMSIERMDSIRQSFFPCLQLFFDASESSALSTVAVEQVVDTIVSLCDCRHLPAERGGGAVINGPTPHDNLAEELLNKMHRDPYSSEVKYFCRALCRLWISPNADARALFRLCRKLQKKIESVRLKRQLCKFEAKLQQLLETDGASAESNDTTIDTQQRKSSAEQPGSSNTDDEVEENGNNADEDDDDEVAPPAHDIALRKRLERTSAQRDVAIFSDDSD